MSTKHTVLSNYRVIDTGDPEYARDRLVSTYGATSFEPRRDEAKFRVRASLVRMGDLELSYCGYDSDVSLGFGEIPFVRQIFNLRGTAQYSTAGLHGQVAPGTWSGVLPANTPVRFEYRSAYQHLMLRIEQQALRRNLEALIGKDVANSIVFEADVAADRQPASNLLRRTIFQFAADFNTSGSLFSDLAAAEIKRAVIMQFLLCHRHDYSHFLYREPPSSTFSAVKKVEAFIEANWDKPIDIEAMAAVGNVSARTLFRQFREDRGYSPADFAKRVRLDRARERLERADPDTSVTQTALRCGFQNLGHFARDYRLAFGELPSTTLRKSDRRRLSNRK
jgi:AraC-like DNA-binding protein